MVWLLEGPLPILNISFIDLTGFSFNNSLLRAIITKPPFKVNDKPFIFVKTLIE